MTTLGETTSSTKVFPDLTTFPTALASSPKVLAAGKSFLFTRCFDPVATPFAACSIKSELVITVPSSKVLLLLPIPIMYFNNLGNKNSKANVIKPRLPNIKPHSFLCSSLEFKIPSNNLSCLSVEFFKKSFSSLFFN